VLRSFKYGLYGAVLAGLVAAPVVWNTVDKSVHLVVDGRSQTVQTTAQQVGEIVRSAGFRVTAHDLLAPAASASVKDGARIVLRRGRLLHLDVDGTRTDVWTTAPTVAEALAQLGYSASDFVSVSRARRLPLGATDLAIRTPRLLTVIHDGRHEQVTTTDATVGSVLADLGITVGASDRVSVPVASAPTAGETVRIQRVTHKTVTRSVAIPFPTQRHNDPTLPIGTTKVVSPGKKGTKHVVYAVVYLDGKVIGQTRLRSVVVTKPTARVLRVGTKRPVTSITRTSGTTGGSGGTAASAPAPSPGTAQAIAKQLLTARGWGSDQYNCLVTLWNHESGWRVHAANGSGAYGIPQALPGSKMGSAGPDWQNNAETQIKWGLGYISSRYGTPCGAWSSWQANGWY
jgi:uncharacterized protein YabE (DUF348 family)